MCMLCPDFVDNCIICPPSGGRVSGHLFFLGSTFCFHLISEHGTDLADHYAHFAWGDHTGDDCGCRTGNWWDGRPDPINDWNDDE